MMTMVFVIYRKKAFEMDIKRIHELGLDGEDTLKAARQIIDFLR